MKKDVKEVNISNIDYIMAYIFFYFTILLMIYNYFILYPIKTKKRNRNLSETPSNVIET